MPRFQTFARRNAVSNATFGLADVLFYFIAAATVASAGLAVFSRNIVRSVFSLLATFFGVASLYALLSSDFLAIVQLMIYVGGILVLLLFAVMLTSQIESAERSNRSGQWGIGITLGIGLIVLLVSLAFRAPWREVKPGDFVETTRAIGQSLLGENLLPFEVAGLLIATVVVGSVAVARRQKTQNGKERS
jgi:NADH:ubiquinone oxidoreductase subunit 6 (subunit J)